MQKPERGPKIAEDLSSTNLNYPCQACGKPIKRTGRAFLEAYPLQCGRCGRQHFLTIEEKRHFLSAATASLKAAHKRLTDSEQ